MHSFYNNIPLNQLDNAHVRGSVPIDSIAISSRLMSHVERIKLLERNEVVTSDHRAYLLDVNVEEYFELELSFFNQINKRLLNPSRKSHRMIFCQAIEEQLDICKLEGDLFKPSLTYHEIEKLDKSMTKTLNYATKKVKG